MSAKTITLTDEVSSGVDRFIAAQEERQNPDQVVNALLADWLTEQGILPYAECPPEVKAAGECE